MALKNRVHEVPCLSAILLLLLACFSSPSEALYGENSDVLLLDPSNFLEAIEEDSVVLVEFFAPWCGHCKSLVPVWEKAAAALRGVAVVAAVDADAAPSLAQEYGVQGFPTIKAFLANKKNPIEYNGARDLKSITDFALKQVKALVSARISGTPGGRKTEGGGGKAGESNSVELTSDNFEEQVLASNELWLVEFFAPWCGHCKKLAPEWKQAAKSLKGKVNLGQVDCTADESLCSSHNVKGYPTILVFGADKSKPTPYEGARTAGAIESFALETLQSNMPSPDVHEITSPEVFAKRCSQATICFVAILPDILDTGASGRNQYLDLLKTVGEKHKKYGYSYVWAPAGAQPELEKVLGMGGYGYPALVALNVKKAVYAPFKSSFQIEHLSDFILTVSAVSARGTVPLEGEIKVVSAEPWDGLDGQLPVEEEFSLDDLMGEDTRSADEL